MSFLLPSDVKVYLYLAPCDMRKSINTLSILVAETLQLNPSSGHLFLFRSKSKDKMKALYYSQNCFSLLYRRCEQGKFIFPHEEEGYIECELPVSMNESLRFMLYVYRYSVL